MHGNLLPYTQGSHIGDSKVLMIYGRWCGGCYTQKKHPRRKVTCRPMVSRDIFYAVHEWCQNLISEIFECSYVCFFLDSWGAQE